MEPAFLYLQVVFMVQCAQPVIRRGCGVCAMPMRAVTDLAGIIRRPLLTVSPMVFSADRVRRMSG